MMRRAALLGVSAFLLATHGWAQQDREFAADSLRIQLEYPEFLGCPDEEEFRSEVRRWTQRADWVLHAATRLVRIDYAQDGRVGSLRIVPKGAQALDRAIGGRDCAEVSEALAFALAVNLDPSVRLAEPPDAPAAGTEGLGDADLPQRTKTLMAGARTPTVAPATQDKMSPSPPARKAASIERVDRTGRGSGWHLAGAATAETGLNRSVAPGILLRAGWQRRSRGSLTSGARLFLDPQLEVGTRHTFAAEGPSGRQVSARKHVGLLQFCGLFWKLSARLQLYPCASVDVGVLRVGAPSLDVSTPKTIFQLASGLDLRLEWGSGLVRGDVGTGFRFNAFTPEFVSGQGPLVRATYEASSFSALVSLGLGLRFSKSGSR